MSGASPTNGEDHRQLPLWAEDRCDGRPPDPVTVDGETAREWDRTLAESSSPALPAFHPSVDEELEEFEAVLEWLWSIWPNSGDGCPL